MQECTKRNFFGLGYSYVLLGLLTYTLFSLFQSMGLPTLIGQLVLNSELETSSLTSMNTISGFWTCIAIFFMAPLSKRIGIRSMTIAGFILLSISTFMWGQCQTPMTYLVLVLIQSVGIVGVLQVGSIVLMSNWFPRTKGVIMGIITVGIYVATFTFVPVIAYASPIYGFTTVMNVLAAALLIIGIACFFWIKDTPEQVGMFPDNQPVETTDQALEMGESAAEWSGKQLLLSKRGIMYTLVFGFSNLAIRGMGVSTIPLILEAGFDMATTSLINLGLGVIACVGSILIGMMDTKCGPKKASIFFCLLCTVSLLGAYFTASSMMISLIFLALFFFGNGSLANLAASMLMSMYGRNHFVRATQYLSPLVNLIVAFSYLFVGRIIGEFDSYSNVQLLFGLMMAVSLVFVFFMDDTYVVAPSSESVRNAKLERQEK